LPSGAEPEPPSDPSAMSDPVTGGAGRDSRSAGARRRDGAPSPDPEPRSSRSESRLDPRLESRRVSSDRLAAERSSAPPSSSVDDESGPRGAAWSTAGAPSAAATIPAPETVPLPGSPVPIGPSTRTARTGDPADCNAAITCLTGASAAARGSGSAGGGTAAGPVSAASSTPTPEVNVPSPRALLPSTVVTASSAPAATAAPVGRRPGAGLEEVARAGDERPVHGVRGPAALPAEQGADGDEAVRLGSGMG
jgi:hypothetical protein